jgi:hypothetical protein
LPSRHAQAWKSDTFRAASENYTRVECLSCHAPDLILRTGPGQQPTLREDHRDGGVTCIVCHQDANADDWLMHGPYEVDSPGHDSAQNATFQTAEICQSCHGHQEEFNQYHSWKEGPYGQSAFPCQMCHMPQSERLLADTEKEKPLRWVGDHRFPGAHDEAVLRSAAKVRLRAEGPELVVEVVNEAGHLFPGGAYREAVLTVAAGGRTVEVLRFSYEEGRRIGPGETWTKKYRLPDASGRAAATLTFRRTIGEDAGIVVAQALLDPRQNGGP